MTDLTAPRQLLTATESPFSRTPVAFEQLRAALRAALDENERLRAALAGLADTINQELRENGPLNVPQANSWADDLRPLVRLLVDLVRSPAAALREAADEAMARPPRSGEPGATDGKVWTRQEAADAEPAQ